MTINIKVILFFEDDCLLFYKAVYIRIKYVLRGIIVKTAIKILNFIAHKGITLYQCHNGLE